MKLDEAKELLESCGYLVEDDKPNYGLIERKPRSNKPRTNLFPFQEAQLKAFADVMGIVDNLIDRISENDEDSELYNYVLKQLIKAQQIEKRAKMVK